MWQQFRQKSNHLHPHRVISLDNGSGGGGGEEGGRRESVVVVMVLLEVMNIPDPRRQVR